MKKWTKLVVATTLIAPMVTPVLEVRTFAAEDEDIVKLRFLETTDLHTNSMNYDYFKDVKDETVGLVKAATVIKEQRGAVAATNSFLFDNGDTLQGTPFGDYIKKQFDEKKVVKHPMYELMDYLDYDAVTLGNHEFNFGLDFLKTMMEGSKGDFRFVNSNVIDKSENKPLVAAYNEDGKEYQIIERKVTDADGEVHTVKVGVFGVVPPQIMAWDAGNLQGKVEAKDIIPVAKETVAKLKAEGADIIVALAHTGIGDTADQKDGDENVGYALTQIADIDVLMTGHQHGKFPDANSSFNSLPNVDKERGTINGKPVVMANTQGKNVGVIDLEIELIDGKWTVKDSAAKLADVKADTAVDQGAVDLIKSAHEGTLTYINQEVGQIADDIQSYFALVKDDDSVQFVTNAQKWYVQEQMKSNADLQKYKDLPLLSAGAPFKAGGRNLVNASDYTMIKKGPIALKNVADLYVYPNTLEVVKVTGADIMNWLEMSAGLFNQLDGKNELINKEFRSYNFDVLDGLTYEIDVTQPAKYDFDGKLVNEKANRIKNVEYAGKPIKLDQEFLVATNNYRASSAKFPGVGGGQAIVYKSAYETRNVISDYIRAHNPVDYKADDNWKLVAPQKTESVFETADAGKSYTDRYEGITSTETTRAGEVGTFRTYKLAIDQVTVDLTLKANVIKPGAKTVTGSATPKASVAVKSGTETLGKATADENGKFTVTVKKPLKLRQSLTLTATLGKEQVETKAIVGEGFVGTPAISEKTAFYGSKALTGTATDGLTVKLYKDRKYITKTTAKDGFRFAFSKGLTFGTYTVKTSDISGKITKTDTFVLKANHPLKKWSGKKRISGKTAKRGFVRLYVKTASGYVHLATDQADAKGNYSLQLRKTLVDGTYVIKSYSKEHVHTGNEHFLSVK